MLITHGDQRVETYEKNAKRQSKNLHYAENYSFAEIRKPQQYIITTKTRQLTFFSNAIGPPRTIKLVFYTGGNRQQEKQTERRVGRSQRGQCNFVSTVQYVNTLWPNGFSKSHLKGLSGEI